MTMKLYDEYGRRKYLTDVERTAFLKAAATAAPEVRTFCHVLAYTGCRLSEALSVTPGQVDYANGVIVFESLKKRKRGEFRAVPIPPILQDMLISVHKLHGTVWEMDEAGGQTRLWPWARITAWRHVKDVLRVAELHGPQATPKGLRHGFGVAAISAGVPLNLVQRWLGHAQMSTTAIYANAIGEEERQIAARMWAPLPRSQ